MADGNEKSRAIQASTSNVSNETTQTAEQMRAELRRQQRNLRQCERRAQNRATLNANR